MFPRLLKTNNDPVLTLLRVTLGVIFFAHGAQKVLGWFGGYGFSATFDSFTKEMGIPAVFAVLAIAAEFLGGVGLLVGFLTRIAAFGIFANMAVAVMMIHHKFGLFMNWMGNQKGEGIEYHLLVLAMCAALMVWGAGAFSLDSALSRK